MTAYIGWLHISDNSYSLKKHFLLKNIVAAFGFFAVILFGALLSYTDVAALILYFAAITCDRQEALFCRRLLLFSRIK